MGDYVICVRRQRRGEFIAEPGPTKFLEVPPGQLPHKDFVITRRTWVDKVMAEARPGADRTAEHPPGDILVFIHGYNNPLETVMWRHRQLRRDLEAAGFDGAVVSFDWPSDKLALNYLEDRSDAKVTAIRLVDDCIRLFSTNQMRGCEINVHLLAHSTGAYVIREAFDDADDRRSVASFNWTVSQICLIGADVSQRSMAADNAKSSSIFRHCVRLTNYQNPYDSVLKLSNVKRVGVAPRLGRVGLPADAPDKAVNVNCGEYFKTLHESSATFTGAFDHSWHVGDPVFTEDLLNTIRGDVDRSYLSTRVRKADGSLFLQR